MEDYVYIGLDFFPCKYCGKKVILRKRMIAVDQEWGKNSTNEVGTERSMVTEFLEEGLEGSKLEK